MNSQYCVPKRMPLCAARIAVEARPRGEGRAHARVSDPEAVVARRCGSKRPVLKRRKGAAYHGAGARTNWGTLHNGVLVV